MPGHTVSLILTMAIIVCPLQCGSGWCDVAGCCMDRPTAAPCQAECCRPPAVPEDDQNVPGPIPKKSSCQGVCGGAVCVKPCELDVPQVTSVLPAIATQESSSRWADHRWFDRLEHLHCGSNHGRTLRILHVSYLC